MLLVSDNEIFLWLILKILLMMLIIFRVHLNWNGNELLFGCRNFVVTGKHQVDYSSWSTSPRALDEVSKSEAFGPCRSNKGLLRALH